MNKDSMRFTDAKTLAEKLAMSVDKAVELAVKADAIMRIGTKQWYDWEKAVEYKSRLRDRQNIAWIGIMKQGMGQSEHDIKISIDNGKRPRMRIRINNASLEGMEKKKRMLVGLLDNRLYVTFSDNEGYSTENNQTTTAINITPRAELKKFIGEYDILHRCADDLAYIDLDEKVMAQKSE